MQRKVCCPPSCYIWPRLRSAQVIITWLVLWLWEARRVLVIRLHYWFVALLLIFYLWSNSTYSLVAASVFRSHRVWKGCISCLMPLQFEMNSWKCLNHNLLFSMVFNCNSLMFYLLFNQYHCFQHFSHFESTCYIWFCLFFVLYFSIVLLFYSYSFLIKKKCTLTVLWIHSDGSDHQNIYINPWWEYYLCLVLLVFLHSADTDVQCIFFYVQGQKHRNGHAHTSSPKHCL